MHEMAVTEDILKIVLKHAGRNGITKIISITIEIGPLADLEGEWLHHYFTIVSKGSVAADAKIKIIKLQPFFYCSSCCAEFAASLRDEHILCAKCNSSKVFLKPSTTYTIRDMEAI